MATTIPAGTLRLLLTSISYRAKARKEMRREPPMVPRRRRAPAAGLLRRVEGASRCALTADRCQIASRRADFVQVEALTHQQVRRVCTADSVPALASDPQTAGADPAGLAWSAICYTLIYLIIIRRLVSGMRWRCCGSVIRSSVSQAVRYSWMPPPHNSGKTRQIAGKAPVKPGALFCAVGGITAWTE